MAYGTLTALLASLYSTNTNDCLSLVLSLDIKYHL